MCKISTLSDVVKLFPKSPNQIEDYANECMKIIEAEVKKIINIPDNKRTFENTALALDKIGSYYTPVYSAIYALEVLSPDQNLREKAHETILKLSNFMVDHVSNNIELYKAFKAYAQKNGAGEDLDEIKLYFIKETMDDFKRSGLDLPEDKLKQVKELIKELAALSLAFEANIAQSKCKILVTKQELAGLQEDFINALQKEGDKFVLGCDYPTYFAVIDNCKVESTRKNMYIAFHNRAYPENIEVLEKIIKKRDELAKLIGFKNYNSMVIDSQMAKTPENVYTFLSSLLEKATNKAKKEVKKFMADLPESVKLESGKLKPWDSRFLKEYYKKKYLNLDAQEVAKYFPMENTIAQLLDIYQQFLSIKFKEVSLRGKFWHEDVKLIEVYNNCDVLLGYLLLDLYPRPNKFSHAAHMTIVPATFYYKDSKKYICPSVSVVMANFPKATQNCPALLKFNDVETFFHEFGHALHAILGSTELSSFSGTTVKRDFVEMPSQMLENWLKDKEILQKVSKHYLTGQPLPENIIDTIIKTEQFDSGDSVLRQIFFSRLSLAFFANGAYKDTQRIAKDLHKEIIDHVSWSDNNHMQASFGHLTDYGPSYYGYLWSNVFAKDLFSEINKKGLLNPEIGQKYINQVIGLGGSKDPNQILVDFLSRKPNQEAYFKSLGFVD